MPKKGTFLRNAKARIKREAKAGLPLVKGMHDDLRKMGGRGESVPMHIGRGARKGYDTTTKIIRSDIRGARARRRLKPQFVLPGQPAITENYGTKNLSHDYGERNLTSGTPW